MSTVLRFPVVLLGRRGGRRLPRLSGVAHRAAQRAASPRQRPCPPGALGAQLHPAARCAADPAGAGHPGLRRGDAGARRRDRVRIRRPGPAAVRPERHDVPGRTGRQLAQANPVDLPRRRQIRGDRRRPRHHARLHLGRERGWPVHRARRVVHRARPGAAELGRADHLGSAPLVRAAVSARRLDRRPVGAWPGRRSQLACHAYRHRQRHDDHAELGAGRRVVQELQPAGRAPTPSASPPSSRWTTRPTTSSRC